MLLEMQVEEHKPDLNLANVFNAPPLIADDAKMCATCHFWRHEECLNGTIESFMITQCGGEFTPDADFGCNLWEAKKHV